MSGVLIDGGTTSSVLIANTANTVQIAQEDGSIVQVVQSASPATMVTSSGPAGKSAYEVAVANGFVGTQAEWLASLQGSGGTWGSITGTISSQTDLQSALNAKAASTHSHAQSDVTGLSTALAGKEPTITAGTTGQYYRGDKTFQTLDKSAVGLANVDNTSDANKPVSTAQATAIGAKLDATHAGTGGTAHANVIAAGAAGFMTGSDKTKLDGIATGATANSSDATLLNRANHTGTQAVTTTTLTATSRIVGRTTAGAGTAEELTGTQATALLDTANGTNKGLMSSADFTKLSGVATGATANSSDATLLNRANHTGTQAVTTTTLTATSRLVGRTTAGAGGAEELTGTQATALLDTATQSVKGLLSAADKTKLDGITGTNTGDETGSTILTKLTGVSGGGTTNFLRADGVYAAPPGGAGISDGDKGDITVSGSGATWTIDANTISLAKMAQVASGTFLGRVTAATGNVEALTGTQATTLLDTATTSLKGLLSASDKTKLDGIASGATANSSDATLLNRANHTGTQAVTTTTLTATSRIVGRTTAGAGAAEELTGTQATAMLDLANGTTKGLMSSADFTKLSGVATGATANSSDATLLNRANHTGTQAVTTTTLTATSRFVGRTTAGAGAAEELTGTQATALLDLANGSTKGLMSSADYTKLSNVILGIKFVQPGTSSGGDRIAVVADYTFTASQTNSYAKALVAATASTVYTIKKGTIASPTTIGTFTFAVSGTTATVSITAGAISAGDTVWIEAPTTADTTLAEINFLVRQ